MRTWVLVLVMVIIAGLALAAIWPIASYGETMPVPILEKKGGDASEFIDLLWWLRRAGNGGWGFAEMWNNWGTASGYFHGGPSR